MSNCTPGLNLGTWFDGAFLPQIFSEYLIPLAITMVYRQLEENQFTIITERTCEYDDISFLGL